MAEALRAILHADAKAAADENVLVALDEAASLHPWLRALQQRMRDEGGPGTRVHVDALVQRAMDEAMAGWEQGNPRRWALDHRWLSLDEIAAIGRLDPELGELTAQAAQRVRDEQAAGEVPPGIRAFFDDYDFEGRRLHEHSLPGGQRIDARPGQPGRSTVPAAVVQAFDYYYRAEAADWATVSLHHGTLAGGEVWVVYTTTDGDAGFLEILDGRGATLDGARLHADQILAWDELPGRVRLAHELTTLGGFATEEGLSEPEERAAAGQPPTRWPGEWTPNDTRLYPVLDRLGRIEFAEPAPTPEMRELAVAALDHLWDMPLRYSSDRGEPVRLGPGHAGVLSVGTFVRPTDGQTYQVANWRDIDDASYVLYYQRTATGLELKISQFDN